MILPTPSPAPIVLAHRPADHALLQRVIEQEGIARGVAGPEWSDYLVNLAGAALEALSNLLSPARDLIAGLGLSMETVATVLLALLFAVITALAAIGVWRLLRRRRAAALADAPGPVAGLQQAPHDPGAWRSLLEERLRAGGIGEALEAAWWWLAASVSRGPVDPAWTSRELLLRAGRTDLARWATALDRMTYGPERPAAEDVRGLVAALEAAV
jgi:hypothetical protein